MNDFQVTNLTLNWVDAEYWDATDISSYSYNPLIEALGPPLTSDEAAKRMKFYPKWNDVDCLKPKEVRLELIENARRFFTPLSMNLDVYRRIWRMVRYGYTSRNPALLGYWRSGQERADSIVQGNEKADLSGLTGSELAIVGMPGVGKSVGVQRALSVQPQVIRHRKYRGCDLSFLQITWIKLDCPFDGSIKGLCYAFFQEVDRILHTSYYESYCRGSKTVDQLLPSMARVVWNHSVGVLVIDEIQQLKAAKSGGTEKMLNFFVHLQNTLGVPLVLVGTYDAVPLLSEKLHQARRSCGEGSLVWHRMKKDDPEWALFIETLWRYQYLRHECKLSDELRNVLYDVSCGIPDFACKAYMLAQERVIEHEGEEVLAENIFWSVARDRLELAEPILSAIRVDEVRALKKAGDVIPPNITVRLRSARDEGQQFEDLPSSDQMSSVACSPSEPAQNWDKAPNAGDCPEVSHGNRSGSGRERGPAHADAEGASPSKQPSRRHGSNVRSRKRSDLGHNLRHSAPAGSLPAIVADGREQGLDAYGALQRAGWIRYATEFFGEGVVG